MLIRFLIVAACLCGPVGRALADGGGGSEPVRNVVPASEFARALNALERGDFQRAAGLLELHTRRHPDDAEGWNRLGFARRKAGMLDAAFVAYRRALDLDPRHLGAHEYIGEAYLAAGDVASAEKHLAVLAELCRTPCEQHADLQAAIARHRAGAAGR
ncbi:MAG: tetratricopeptide repeat protein [Rhodocyclaceae bacterium]|nr:tetratricopeptide repeat protein [Rhodocyclaceae bacterium]